MPKSVSSPLEMSIMHGIRRTSDRRCGRLYNSKIKKNEEVRVFPLSNWTEKDIWQYIKRENIEISISVFCKGEAGCIPGWQYHHGR